MQTYKPPIVLGCGPAGLFAAQALAEQGYMPLIFSVKKKSEIHGAQYLHKPIRPFSNDVPGEVVVIRLGRARAYANRVYGSYDETTSWTTVKSHVPIWDLRTAYDRAWEYFEPMIIDQNLDADEVADMTARFPLVISTIPRWAICCKPDEHKFESVPILVRPVMEYTGLRDYWQPDQNVVIYNGTEHGAWYRTSQIFGYKSSEYVAPHGHDNPLDLKGAQAGFKVVGTNCDCHPNVTFTGRLGLWQRGVLTHHAYEAAVEASAEALAI